MSNNKPQMRRGTQRYQSKYPDLTANGRLFPSWIMANYNQYKLEPVDVKPGTDPCKRTDYKGRSEVQLRQYQQFLSAYLDFKSRYRDILIYHGLGSGKTASSIGIYNALYNYTPGWNVFILIKASLKGGWLADLKKWITKDEYEFRFKNIIFVHYDSPIADRKFLEAVKGTDRSKKSLYIIDEVHNFIRNVYSNISSQSGKRAQTIYDYIIQDKLENPDTRTVLLSATPAINKPFEFALLFNLLRPNLFPRSENEFNSLFVSNASYPTISKTNKNMFQRRILGLVSFYIGATPDLYASKRMHYVNVPMSEYQQDIYSYFEEIEEKQAMQAKLRGGSGSTTYKSYTRQACNFVFPPISQQITGENRPRPGKFRISEREAIKLNEGKTELKAEKGSDKVLDKSKYFAALELYIKGFINYLREANNKDKDGHTLKKDIETFIKKYEGDFLKFAESEKKKSNLYQAMNKCSAKMTMMCFNIMKSPGPVTVYSNYVLMEGLEVLKIYLDFFGFYSYHKEKKLIKDRQAYVEFHGGIDFEERFKVMKLYNQTENKLGEIVKIILISPAGSEGLNLRNVRQTHIMEPYWNEVRITQMVGRGIRQCSHGDLKQEDRVVDVFRYKSVRSKGDKRTTDQYIEMLARKKDGLIQSFLDTMKEAAIDCVLNEEHNQMAQKYKCFQFQEPSLFAKFVGPAYKRDLQDDKKIDNGLNSTNAINVKIKVIKIQAAMLLSKPDEEPKYSKPKNYWYYPKSGVVYDFEMKYAIGRVGYDVDGLPMKNDKDTYVIDKVIPIPTLDD